MKCPNCNQTLVMTDRQGVEIDYCPDCRGVWLDKGELDKILERSAQYESNNGSSNEGEQRYYQDNDPRKQQYHTHKKKKGFLGDFFDFD